MAEALEGFAENTMRFLRDEGKLLAQGLELPQLRTRFRDRHALVVARGPDATRDLRIVRPYIRNFKPVLVGVDGGADKLIEAGYKPEVIVGDMDSVSDEALGTPGPSWSCTRTRTGVRPGSSGSSNWAARRWSCRCPGSARTWRCSSPTKREPS